LGGKKRILIIGINFSPEPTGIGKYTGEMALWLSENGYSCDVITSSEALHRQILP
jgi:colanic acid biosynthesis glycosyl transferase WcaI